MLLHKIPHINVSAARHRIFWWNREQYENRGGLRTIEDIRQEEVEKQEGKEINPIDYTIFGNKRRSFKDLFFYSDRSAGKGYSDYVHNLTYPGRVYVWPPLRRLMTIYAVVLSFACMLLLIDYEWFKKQSKSYLNSFKSEAATLCDESDGRDTASSTDNQSSDSDCLILSVGEVAKKKKKKIGFRERRIIEYENRIRAYSSPDKIFRYFATLKATYEDGTTDIFMTPEDFVRSLTPGVIQPRHYGLDKFKTFNPCETKIEHRGKDVFYWMGPQGLINYSDYLFLMTLLSTPPSEFRLAFFVFDENGDGELDATEFEKVQDLVLKQSNVGQRHRDHVTGAGTFRKSKTSIITKYFFGINETEKLKIEKFLKFQQDLYRDILRIEFERRDPESNPVGIISEISFAELLLLHANLPNKKQKKMMKRVRKKYKHMPHKKGISFHETNNFFAFLYHIDKVDMALHFYKLAGRPLTEEMIKKLARKITGVELSDTVVNILVALFDENGDGQLSQKEFITIMKKRMQIGLERPKDTGLIRTMDAFYECGKKQIF